ncbi:ribonuclease HIII [bacterium]|nr:ribonuclease HIII [bacterium]
MNDQVGQLDRLLKRIELLEVPLSESPEGTQLFNEVCRLVLQEGIFRCVWSEQTLNFLDQLFKTEPPDRKLFEVELNHFHELAIELTKINDFFFNILESSASSKDLCDSLSKLHTLTVDFPDRLDASVRLTEIRNQKISSSEKINSFLDFLKDDLGVDLTQKESVKGVLVNLRNREAVGNVNALLVKGNGNAVVVRIHIKLQLGSAKVEPQVKGTEGFVDAVGRARSNMQELGYIGTSEDVLYSLEFTDRYYEGSSLGLAAAVCIYDIKQNLATDPYTAFTGEINLDGQEWKIKPVFNIKEKLSAAKRSGYRRVFIPFGNYSEVSNKAHLKIYPVDSLVDAFVQLRPGQRLSPGNSKQGKKIAAIQENCERVGWDLSRPELIQHGVQFNVVPLEISPLKLQVYNSGAHTPKTSPRKEYDELFSTLNAYDHSPAPIRSINQSLNLQDRELQEHVRIALEKIQPNESRSEQYCTFSFKFERDNEKLSVKQYSSGKLVFQGSAGPLYKTILETIIPLFKVRNPKSTVTVDELLRPDIVESKQQASVSTKSILDVPLPHIGTDESGKGDYFGPMVIAGVFLDSSTYSQLIKLGVKDSKLLSDKRSKEMAAAIRELIKGRYQEVEILPESYNRLYEDFKAEGKNLNHLLAWGHARAIESLLQRWDCSYAIADQFGDERYIQSKLMEKGKRLQLIQLPKGERYIAVAAASILARDKFLTRLENLQKTYGIEFPKGASETVVHAASLFVKTHGFQQLHKVAKVHHKTTLKLSGG